MTKSGKAAFLALAGLAIGVFAGSAQAVDAPSVIKDITFTEKDGQSLYQATCQGCHMPNGMGAKGAGAYPALAKNENLAVGGYVVTMVLNGRKAMPAFRNMMNDDQIAAVAGYVRSHFGNNFKEAVTAKDVQEARAAH